MKISFFYEYGEIDGIGTGHKYRSLEVAKHLSAHDVNYVSSVPKECDIFVIDHMGSQEDIIVEAKQKGQKVFLIDGSEDDVCLVDRSVSAILNKKAEYRGIEYVAFPVDNFAERYILSDRRTKVFVGMGGFDKNKYTKVVVDVLLNIGADIIVADSINHNEISGVEVFGGKNYFDAMSDCIMGVTNGGLTLFQSIYYGLPCVSIPQYEHQKENIKYVDNMCIMAEPNKEDLTKKIKKMLSCAELRKKISDVGKNSIDGLGAFRVAKLIEGLYGS